MKYNTMLNVQEEQTRELSISTEQEEGTVWVLFVIKRVENFF